VLNFSSYFSIWLRPRPRRHGFGLGLTRVPWPRSQPHTVWPWSRPRSRYVLASLASLPWRWQYHWNWRVGPVQDNRRCYSPSTFGSSPRCNSAATMTTFQTTTTDNYNQILLVDNQRDFLVTCGSVFQVCSVTFSILLLFQNCIFFRITDIDWRPPLSQ